VQSRVPGRLLFWEERYGLVVYADVDIFTFQILELLAHGFLKVKFRARWQVLTLVGLRRWRVWLGLVVVDGVYKLEEFACPLLHPIQDLFLSNSLLTSRLVEVLSLQLDRCAPIAQRAILSIAEGGGGRRVNNLRIPLVSQTTLISFAQAIPALAGAVFALRPIVEVVF
jgi:hypothetical protein